MPTEAYCSCYTPVSKIEQRARDYWKAYLLSRGVGLFKAEHVSEAWAKKGKIK
jgi:hypothetical protein